MFKQVGKSGFVGPWTLETQTVVQTLATGFVSDQRKFNAKFNGNLQHILLTLSCPISCAIMDNDVTNISEPPLPINTAVAYTVFRASTGWILNQTLALTESNAPRQNVIWEETEDESVSLLWNVMCWLKLLKLNWRSSPWLERTNIVQKVEMRANIVPSSEYYSEMHSLCARER